MPPDTHSKPEEGKRRGQRGFALIGAIFVIVILGLVGAAMLRLASMQQLAVSQGLLGARAYYAARSGVEWALSESASSPGTCPATTISLSEGGVAGFNVDVSCTSSSHTEGGVSTSVLQLSSRATYGSFGDADYASRTVSATVRPPP